MVREYESMQEVYEWVTMGCRLRYEAPAKGLGTPQPVSPGELRMTFAIIIMVILW